MALDEGRMPLNFLEARAAKMNGGPLHMNIAPFTLVLTTNLPGKLKPALRSRLHALELDRYDELELKEIASQAARAEGLQLTGQAAGLLGETALGNPRTVRQRVERLRLTVSSDHAKVNDVRHLLRLEGVDSLGLKPNQRLYLKTLAGARDQTLRLEMLVVKLGLDAPYLRQEIECALVELGLIVVSQQYRVITREGLKVAGKIINIPETNNKKREGTNNADNKCG
jgi:Holliday junction resolvasome RuvABC ATP-dependent DNA helicase subunit